MCVHMSERRAGIAVDHAMLKAAREKQQEPDAPIDESRPDPINLEEVIPVVDVQGLARVTHIPKATILTLRSRSPELLPPPFRTHPLLWRMHTVVSWMERQEEQEAERIAHRTRRRNGL